MPTLDYNFTITEIKFEGPDHLAREEAYRKHPICIQETKEITDEEMQEINYIKETNEEEDTRFLKLFIHLALPKLKAMNDARKKDFLTSRQNHDKPTGCRN